MAANFCFMRMAKIKLAKDLTQALQHNIRERQPLNADPDRSSLNIYEGGSVAEVKAKHQERLPDKVRKNAVIAVEVLMTASPDFQGSWEKYMKDCQNWAEGLFGKENVLHVAKHNDETTPHIHVIFMPMKDGKLNASHFLAGSKHRMIELQNDFYEKVGKAHGLDRGISKDETRAKHLRPSLAEKEKTLERKIKSLAEREKELERNIINFEEQYAEFDKDYKKPLNIYLKAKHSPEAKNVIKERGLFESKENYEARIMGGYVGRMEKIKEEQTKAQAMLQEAARKQKELAEQKAHLDKMHSNLYGLETRYEYKIQENNRLTAENKILEKELTRHGIPIPTSQQKDQGRSR